MGNRQGAADSIVESMNLSALELPESNSKNFLLTVMGPGGGGWRLGAEAGASDGVMGNAGERGILPWTTPKCG